MDKDRRDAAAWAKEWYIRKKNRRLLYALAAIVLVFVIWQAISFAVVHTQRTTFKSEEDMRKAMQGRYVIEYYYEDIVIEGDDITLTYLAFSHYDRDYAEQYGYEYDDEDSVYQDRVEEWDYRHGVIRTSWMGDIIVDKDGNIRRGDDFYNIFYKTDEPRPEPIDPATLGKPEDEEDEEAVLEVEAMIEARDESLESTDEAAKEAGEEAQTGE